jgi:hypothetical protein
MATTATSSVSRGQLVARVMVDESSPVLKLRVNLPAADVRLGTVQVVLSMVLVKTASVYNMLDVVLVKVVRGYIVPFS